MGTTTTNFSFYKPAVGETGWGSLVNANFDTIDTNLVTALLRDYLAGCNLSNNSAAPTTTIDVSAGQAQDATNAGLMVLSASLSKIISGAWVVGNNQNGLGSGVTLTANTTYHFFVIKRTDTGVVDAYFDTSASAANIPTNYTLFRRVGSVITDQSNQILRFVQDGDYFQLTTPRTMSTGTTWSASRKMYTLTAIPLGIQVTANLLFSVDFDAASRFQIYTAMEETDVAPGTTSAYMNFGTGGTSGTMGGPVQIRTTTTQGVCSRNTTAGRVEVLSLRGWWDTRGRFS